MQKITFSPYLTTAEHAMVSTRNLLSHDFQKEATSRLLMMRCVPNIPSAMLIVQGGGGGKSDVSQTVGSATWCATLIIENTFSLSAGQHSKIKNTTTSHGPSKAFHLDSTRLKTNQGNPSNMLLGLPKNAAQPCSCIILLGIISKRHVTNGCADGQKERLLYVQKQATRKC